MRTSQTVLLALMGSAEATLLNTSKALTKLSSASTQMAEIKDKDDDDFDLAEDDDDFLAQDDDDFDLAEDDDDDLAQDE